MINDAFGVGVAAAALSARTFHAARGAHVAVAGDRAQASRRRRD